MLTRPEQWRPCPAGESGVSGPGGGVFLVQYARTPSPGALVRVSPLPQAGEGQWSLT